VLVFDTDGDAGEFAAGYGRVLKRKYPGATRGEDGTWTGTRGGSTAVAVRGDLVLVAEGVPPASLPAVLAALEKTEVLRDPEDAVPPR